MKILFISHEASRTGAPLLLFQFLERIKSKNKELDFDVLLLDGGELETDFQRIASVYNWEKSTIKGPKIIRKIVRKLTYYFPVIRKIQNRNQLKQIVTSNYDVIYANTVVSIPIGRKLQNLLSIPLIVHVHEHFGITKIFEKELIELSGLSKVKFIAVSKLAFQNLIENHSIPANKISLIHPFTDTKKWINFKNKDKDSNHFVINSSGLVQIRKGSDLFVQIANRAIQKYHEIPWLFNWIGITDSDTEYYYKSDIEKLGISDSVKFLGDFSDPISEFSNSDVFLMISREETWGLVCIEHACLGKPIVCFDKGNGIKEFVEQGTGIIVNYMDIEAVVDALASLFNDKELYKHLSTEARKKVVDYDIDIQSKKIISVINNA